MALVSLVCDVGSSSLNDGRSLGKLSLTLPLLLLRLSLLLEPLRLLLSLRLRLLLSSLRLRLILVLLRELLLVACFLLASAREVLLSRLLFRSSLLRKVPLRLLRLMLVLLR